MHTGTASNTLFPSVPQHNILFSLEESHVFRMTIALERDFPVKNTVNKSGRNFDGSNCPKEIRCSHCTDQKLTFEPTSHFNTNRAQV